MAQSLRTKISDKTKDDYPFAKRILDYKKFFKFYFVPIVSIVLFFIVLAFAIIPNITHLINGFEEGQKLKEDTQKLDKRIAKLRKMQEEDERNNYILSKINQIIPTDKSEVVRFRQKVANIGTNKGLSVDSLQAGEVILSEDGRKSNNESRTGFQLTEIPSRFTFVGDFYGFRELLKELYAGDDFFIISLMELNVNNSRFDVPSWKGNFDLTKYQFYEDIETRDYSKVAESEPINKSVIRFIENNFGIFADVDEYEEEY